MTIIRTRDVDAEFAVVVNELTRRRLLAATLGAAAAFSDSGCGNTAARETDGSGDARDTDMAWSFTDDLGRTIRLPRRPVRVVTLADGLTTTLYSAGFTVTGALMVQDTARQLRELGASQSAIGGIVKVGTTENLINLEAVAQHKPDLLVDAVQHGKPAGLGQEPALAKVAPTVSVNQQTAAIDPAMRTIHRLAEALGVTERPDRQAQARYEGAAAQLRAALADKPGLRVAFCWSDTNGLSVNIERQWGYMKTLADLGVEFTPAEAGATDYWQSLSWENAPDIETDLIVLWYGGVPTSPAWSLIPAVRANQYVDMSNDWFVVSYASYADNLTTLLAAVEEARVVA